MPSKKGIPANLRKLADKGLRVRFNGFWLTDSEQDRAIATWLDQTDAAGTIIKHILYNYITGRGVQVPAVGSSDDYDIDDDDDMTNALLNFGD